MISILSITSTHQLSEFCSTIIPCIWAGTFKRQIISPKRHAAFKAFVQKVLKATQISCTCMILALAYIQKLRTAYPSIRASIGSEVRLFTTALLLANKYLDDNTFTNKTWSEVSSIPVNELNIMEMEFLSALNYSIHIPSNEFFTWVDTCQSYYNTLVTTITTTSTIQEPVIVSSASSSTGIKRPAALYTNNDEQQPMIKKKYNSSPMTPPQQQVQQPLLKRSYDYIDSKTKFLSSMDNYYYSYNPINNCKPILSWSSSVSALSSSKYNNHYYI